MIHIYVTEHGEAEIWTQILMPTGLGCVVYVGWGSLCFK